MLGYSNFVLADLPAHQDGVPNRMRSDLEQVRTAGERAAALTSQLLAFSRKQIIQPTILNINTIVGNLEPMLRRPIGEDIDLAARPSSGLSSVQADAGQLEQVIMNLVINARDDDQI